ncbi:MAG: CDP-diacylglycerol--glycerol-3-phosphate 3-phosphatidyltransferase [Oceanicoccus sp.]|jgi:CDP-diacylglycerol--glycerol-3-phosphate 3-phosphatidyltransferase
MNIPNSITLFRILLIPVFVLVFYLPYQWSYWASAAIFSLAGITDWLDGYLARKLDQSTPFGAFLDPVADKLMVVIALVLLVERFDGWWFTIPAMVIIGREIVISALREWMAELGNSTSVAVSYVGKIKTTFQIIAIIVLLAAAPERSGLLLDTGIVVLYISALLTLWSMFIYIRAAIPSFELGSSNKN